MLSFIEFLEERKVDPVELAKRVARRYGKRTNYGPWENKKRSGVQKYKNIPLSSYSASESSSLANKVNRLGAKAQQTTRKTMPIKGLKATQPFNRTDDTEKLKDKITDTNPTHVTVYTHKGKHYVGDGHHAVMAAHLRGDTHIDVNHVDLDKIR
jgi:hypothetical protein